MLKTKYYDHKSNRTLDLESDGCALAEWGWRYGEASFARSPKGFNIFLSPDRIAASDEYADSDPYTVDNSKFHTRRKDLTIDLLVEAVSSIQGTPEILDLGCGRGYITEKMRQALNRAKFTALDHSVSAIEYAHEHYPGIDFAVGDAYDSPYSNDFFDVVVCNNLWEHVPDPLFLLNRIKRIFKPGGYLILSTLSRYRVGNLVRVLRGKSVEFMSRHHVTEYTVGQVVEQLAYGGFQTRKILSRPISLRSMKADVAHYVFAMLISLIGSHHQLEATVFYLAQKTVSTTE